MKSLPFSGKLLVLGAGGVSQCTVPLLLRHLDMPATNVTIVDMVDNRARFTAALEQGARYEQVQITREKFRQQFAGWVGPGDLIVDLTWNLQTSDLVEWCRHHDVRYINTSVELWNPYEDNDAKPTTELTLYHRQMALKRMIAGKGDNSGPTAVLDHGANPGLVSHFTKLGLIDIAKKLMEDKPQDPRIPELQEAMSAPAYNQLAMLLNVKVIHISERDTQITNRPKEVDEFVNTWSVEGFFEEGIAPAEMGWGTHEHKLPPGARVHTSGPQNQICLTRKGMNTWVRSWVPCGEIVGMVIRHGEAYSISDRLTVFDEFGDPVYRPTVHYAYCPCDAAIASLHELRMRNYEMQPRWRIMNDDIVSGRDELGCLLMGHDFKSWWIGSLLDIDETRQLVPGQNPTTLQVAASVLGAVFWMIRNPHAGLNLPDDLPHQEVLDVAMPYLGPFVSQAVDWAPHGYRDVLTVQTSNHPAGDQDPWQFERFLVDEE